ncbi:response regulator transcription factor [Solibacillus sp. A46]|uniref:Response regulator transcription factor n=1 Tax=Solibacillus faecavium TaxID=2762221 RepID=A0ABR8XXQ9_9BACL|nr:response regulator transcription factor [Solibacillus faecavium]MBD8036609.1 response regulator transcription factor [Solibacillus faecavium]
MKILLVDDQAIIRRGLISILSSDEELEIIGEADNTQEALNLFQKEMPDLAIINFHVGDECGLKLIKEARKLGGTCKFAILTFSKDRESFQRAMAMDVVGYISLNSHPEELIYAIQIIQKGKKYYDPDLIDMLVQTQKESPKDDSRLALLTSKEKEVLQKLGMGYSNKQIAHSLYISENTVKKHVSQVLSKLELGDRTQVALFANETGLVQFKHGVVV